MKAGWGQWEIQIFLKILNQKLDKVLAIMYVLDPLFLLSKRRAGHVAPLNVVQQGPSRTGLRFSRDGSLWYALALKFEFC